MARCLRLVALGALLGACAFDPQGELPVGGGTVGPPSAAADGGSVFPDAEDVAYTDATPVRADAAGRDARERDSESDDERAGPRRHGDR